MLEWITPEEGRKSYCGKLYLAYQPGYPLMIADWKTGHGYRDIRTGESIDPIRVAYINLPDMSDWIYAAPTVWQIMNAKYNKNKEAVDAFEFVVKCLEEQEAQGV